MVSGGDEVVDLGAVEEYCGELKVESAWGSTAMIMMATMMDIRGA